MANPTAPNIFIPQNINPADKKSSNFHFDKNFFAGVIAIVFLLTGIVTGLLLLRQEQDIGSSATGVPGFNVGACQDGTCSCANANCPASKPSCYVVYHRCDSNSATACSENSQTFNNGSASLPASGCGTVQIDMGCQGPTGVDTVGHTSWFYPQSCSVAQPTPTTPPSTGGGTLPACGDCWGSGDCYDKPNNEGPSHPRSECIFDNDRNICVWDPGRCGGTGGGGGTEAVCQFEQLYGIKPSYKVGETVSVTAIATILSGNFYDMRFRTYAADGSTPSQTVVSGISANFETATCYANGNCLNSDTGTALAPGTAVIKVFTRVKPCPACAPTATCSMAKILNIVIEEVTPSPSPTAEATPPTQQISAQCISVKIYDKDWNTITASQFSNLGPGNVVRFAAGGSTNGGQFEAARFTINGNVENEVIQKVPGNSNEFYQEYVIPNETANFTIKAELRHSSLGWF